MWANLATFARVLDEPTVTAMNTGAATLALCSFCLVLLAYARRTFGRDARWTWAGVLVVVTGVSVVVPVGLRGSGEPVADTQALWSESVEDPVPATTVSPVAGEVTADVGGVVSAEAVAATRPPCRLAGCAPMSASTFTVACCIARSGVDPPRSCSPSSPQDHWIVPASNASAPPGARCMVIEWVAVPGAYVDPATCRRCGTDSVVDDSLIAPGEREPLSRSSFHS